MAKRKRHTVKVRRQYYANIYHPDGGFLVEVVGDYPTAAEARAAGKATAQRMDEELAGLRRREPELEYHNPSNLG